MQVSPHSVSCSTRIYGSIANYKETQYSKIRIGQPAVIEVDAIPGHEFEGKVSSFSPATGARFALLPPDNASGNFVKVVQRLPVKIEFTQSAGFTIDTSESGYECKCGCSYR